MSCTTACDPNCDALCHASHLPWHKQEHHVSACENPQLRDQLAGAERECEQFRSLLRQVQEVEHITEDKLIALKGHAAYTFVVGYNTAVDNVNRRITMSGLLDPWDACRDVDPFTGQPDQHEHGDACEGICE